MGNQECISHVMGLFMHRISLQIHINSTCRFQYLSRNTTSVNEHLKNHVAAWN